ncbi:DNA-binding protein [Dyella humi]|uniref:DNA-binding protein n=1 Tax=Dyella humi TaxID=1770547 RepID=A0ABW8IEB9_9GAMM
MAIGVPETDVFAAADAVLARGERPTVERVRVELGRGSPARVGQLLEQWWEQLAQRLKGHALLPDLPSEAAQGFAEVWRLAVAQAEGIARTALTAEQNALFAAQTALTQERKLWEIALAEAQTNALDSAAKLAQSELQLRERQTLVDQLTTQVADLLQQRDHLQRQLAQQLANLDTLRAAHASVQEHARTVEDRAHQQVDQARQEIKDLQQRLEREQYDARQRVAQLIAQQEELRGAVRLAEQATAHHTGRVVALEAMIMQWRKTLERPKQISTRRDKSNSASKKVAKKKH